MHKFINFLLLFSLITFSFACKSVGTETKTISKSKSNKSENKESSITVGGKKLNYTILSDGSSPQVASNSNGDVVILSSRGEFGKERLYISEYRDGQWTNPNDDELGGKGRHC